ncbi:MAG: hypothetical protein KJ646_04540 [Nanoarchaeota archaeon]|nr:hypothetical protein [Nanoarchaeota archaeon]
MLPGTEAAKRVAPKIRFWYGSSNIFSSIINKESIIKQTGAMSDYEKLKEGREDWLTQNKYNSEKIFFSKIYAKSKLKKLFGLKDLEICVYNPENPLPNIKIGRQIGNLIQIDALGWGNTYEGRINFEKGYAIIREEEQDLAHRLGLMFTPAGMLEIESLSPSNPEMHKNKKKIDNKNKPIIYCDNPACQTQIRNPFLMIDENTGGAYHSNICYYKDIGIKNYLGVKKCTPKEVTLEEAIELYENGKLQQSPNTIKEDLKLRNIEPWPEGAMLFCD